MHARRPQLAAAPRYPAAMAVARLRTTQGQLICRWRGLHRSRRPRGAVFMATFRAAGAAARSSLTAPRTCCWSHTLSTLRGAAMRMSRVMSRPPLQCRTHRHLHRLARPGTGATRTARPVLRGQLCLHAWRVMCGTASQCAAECCSYTDCHPFHNMRRPLLCVTCLSLLKGWTQSQCSRCGIHISHCIKRAQPVQHAPRTAVLLSCVAQQ